MPLWVLNLRGLCKGWQLVAVLGRPKPLLHCRGCRRGSVWDAHSAQAVPPLLLLLLLPAMVGTPGLAGGQAARGSQARIRWLPCHCCQLRLPLRVLRGLKG